MTSGPVVRVTLFVSSVLPPDATVSVAPAALNAVIQSENWPNPAQSRQPSDFSDCQPGLPRVRVGTVAAPGVGGAALRDSAVHQLRHRDHHRKPQVRLVLRSNSTALVSDKTVRERMARSYIVRRGGRRPWRRGRRRLAALQAHLLLGEPAAAACVAAQRALVQPCGPRALPFRLGLVFALYIQATCTNRSTPQGCRRRQSAGAR